MNMKTMWHILLSLVAVLAVLALALPPSVQAQGPVHVVQRGETLAQIAWRYGTSVSAIMQANGLRNPNLIYVGQRLRIPTGGGSATPTAGAIHVVQRGETLQGIALRYGTTAAAIASTNGLRNPNLIYVGQRLRIPTGGGSAPPTAGAIHVVQRGETLQSIALRYGTTAAAIASANGLHNPNLIYVGQRLRIPGRGDGSSGGGGSRWIEVDLSSQTVRAWQDDIVVRSMVVSTGIARYPTPTGRFHIYAKYPSVTMSGPGYYLPGVPHTMYFYRGYALHGTYWHHNFGHPMSHGCINLTRADAAWLYGWAPVGTLVVIHW